MQALPGPGEELEGSPPGLWPGWEKLGADTPSFSAERADGAPEPGQEKAVTAQAGAWRGLWPPRSAAEGSVGLGAGGLPAQLPGPRLRSPRAGAFQTLLLSRSRSPRPAWGQGSQAAGHRLHASVWGPSSGPPARPLCPPSPQETRPCFPFFSEAGVLGTYTLLGLLFLPALSLPVSMATPPNSRFQAAMTSPSPFLPPRPRGTAAGPGAAGLC